MGEMVEFPANGHTCGGYLAMPSSRRGPGVVVIQEWWGLVQQIKDVCDRLAAEGYIALAPDLYHGKSASTKEPDQAGKLLMEMQLPDAARDMKGAAGWLLRNEGTEGDRVGMVGFCAGGALTLYAATLTDRIGAAVAFYPAFSRTASAKPDYSAIRGGVQGHFADQDHAYTREDVDRVAEEIRAGGAEVEFHWYAGAQHAFFNDERPEVFDEEHAGRAWQRTLEFFRKHLAPTPASV